MSDEDPMREVEIYVCKACGLYHSKLSKRPLACQNMIILSMAVRSLIAMQGKALTEEQAKLHLAAWEFVHNGAVEDWFKSLEKDDGGPSD